MEKLSYSDEDDDSPNVPSDEYVKSWVSDESDSDIDMNEAQMIATNNSPSRSFLPSVDELFTSGSDTRFNFKYVGDATKEFEVPTKGLPLPEKKTTPRVTTAAPRVTPHIHTGGPPANVKDPDGIAQYVEKMLPKEKDKAKYPRSGRTEKSSEAKERVKKQRLSGQSGLGSDFKTWRSDEEMRMRQHFDS